MLNDERNRGRYTMTVRGYVLALACAGTTAGCAGMTAGIRERAEDAFRKQNGLSSEFMLRADELEYTAPSRFEALLALEASMLEACRPLNALAARQNDAEPSSMREQRAVLKSLEPCERATQIFADNLLREPADRSAR